MLSPVCNGPSLDTDRIKGLFEEPHIRFRSELFSPLSISPAGIVNLGSLSFRFKPSVQSQNYTLNIRSFLPKMLSFEVNNDAPLTDLKHKGLNIHIKSNVNSLKITCLWWTFPVVHQRRH